jgi:hypothetical protein
MFAWDHPLLIAFIAGLLGPIAAVIFFILLADGGPGQSPTQISDGGGSSAAVMGQHAEASQVPAKH